MGFKKKITPKRRHCDTTSGRTGTLGACQLKNKTSLHASAGEEYLPQAWVRAAAVARMQQWVNHVRALYAFLAFWFLFKAPSRTNNSLCFQSFKLLRFYWEWSKSSGLLITYTWEHVPEWIRTSRSLFSPNWAEGMCVRCHSLTLGIWQLFWRLLTTLSKMCLVSSENTSKR